MIKTLACIAVIGATALHFGGSPKDVPIGLRIEPVPVTYAHDKATLKQIAYLAATMHDINPERFARQIQMESGFNPNARSRTGAIGIAQIMPRTAKCWRINPHNPIEALDVAARKMAAYWRTYRHKHDADTAYKLALAAYNAGPGAVAKYGKVPPYRETKHYVSVIMGSREDARK